MKNYDTYGISLPFNHSALMPGKFHINIGDAVWGSDDRKTWEKIGIIKRVYGTKSHIRVETDKRVEFHTYIKRGDGTSKLMSMRLNSIFTCRNGVWRSCHTPDMHFCIR